MTPGSAPDDDEVGTFADVLNSFTLDSGRKRRKRGDERQDSREQTGHEEAPPAGQGVPGHRGNHAPDGFGDFGDHGGYPEYPAHRGYGGYGAYEDTGYRDHRPNQGFPSDAGQWQGPGAEETGFVRPYALTGGRTKANHALELETLISTREGAFAVVPAQAEHQEIMAECRAPRSVAEVAAKLRVPLGVARVLISDAADAGLVTVHKTIAPNEGGEAHLMLMERVLSGLRRL